MRLIIHAVLVNAARDIQQHLLFGQRGQHVNRVFDGFQLAIGIENVEFGLIGHESRAGIFLRVGAHVGERGEIAHIADGQVFYDAFQLVAVGGEIGFHLHHAGIEQNGYLVGSRDLLIQEGESGILRAQLLGNAHGGEIEKQHQQAFVVILNVTGTFGGDHRLGIFRQFLLVG